MTAVLRRLVSAEAVAASLAGAGTGYAVGGGPIDLQRAWPHGDASLRVLYGCPGSTEPGAWWSLAYFPGGRLPRPYRTAVAQGQAFLLPELEAVAQRFPADPALPGLDLSMDPGVALERLSPWTVNGNGVVSRVSIRVAGYKPASRCMIEYRATTQGAIRTLWGKCYRKGTDDAAWLTLVAIERARRHGNGSDVLRLAPVAGRLRGARMILWKDVPGRPLLSSGGTEAERAAARTGLALGSMHRLRPVMERLHDAGAELETLGRWVRAAAVTYPDRAALLNRGAEAVRRTAGEVERGEMRASHRDFHDQQVRIDANGATLLDLDMACLAEPELDVGNLLAHLELRSLQGRCADPGKLSGAFLQSYSRRAGAPRPGPLRFYRASALLRLACVYVFRPRWRALSIPLAEAAIGTALG